MNVLKIIVILFLGSYIWEHFRDANHVNRSANRSFFNISNFYNLRRRASIAAERSYHMNKLNSRLIPRIVISVIVIYFLFKIL